MRQTAKPLSTDELNQYRTLGFLVRERQYTELELTELGKAVNHVSCRAAQDDGREYILDNKRFLDTDEYTVQFEYPQNTHTPRVIEPVDQAHPCLSALVDDPRLTLPISSILNTTELALWTAKLNMKQSGGAGFGWHQDSPYWIHDSTHVDLLPNVMLLLDDQHEGNGCFSLIPHSHHQGILPGTDDGSQLGGFYTDPGQFDAQSAYQCELPAGSLVFFNPHTVHGSAPNQSDSPRRALIYTYQPGGFATLKTGCVRNVSA